MHRVSNWAGIALLIALGLSVGLPQQRVLPDPYKVESALVHIPVIVSDPQGRYVPDLKAGDFTLFQDEARQPIALFATAQEPIKIALMLDTSKSTFPVLDRIKKAARRFLQELRPQDMAMIVAFDLEVKVLNRLSADSAQLDEVIKGVKVGDYVGTKLRDAVFEVLAKRFRGIPGRKAIILLTDGQDYRSEVSKADLLSLAAESDTVIYSILYTIDPREAMKKLFGISSRMPRTRSGPEARATLAREKEAADFVEQLSNAGAGRLYRSEAADLKRAFAQITAELRHQYLLGFYPDKAKLDGTLHELRVQVARADVVVRARRSYRATPESR